MTALLRCTFCQTPLDGGRCRGCGGPYGLSDIARRVLKALSGAGFVPVATLAGHCRAGCERIDEALDQIENASIRLHRTEDGVELDEVAAATVQPQVVDIRALLTGNWPASPVVRAASAIARMPARPVPGQPALLAKRMRRRIDDASLDKVAARLAELGVVPASEIEARRAG